MLLNYWLLNRTVYNWRFRPQSSTEESPFYRCGAPAVFPEKRDKHGIKCHKLGERCYPRQSHTSMQANSKWQIIQTRRGKISTRKKVPSQSMVIHERTHAAACC